MDSGHFRDYVIDQTVPFLVNSVGFWRHFLLVIVNTLQNLDAFITSLRPRISQVIRILQLQPMSYIHAVIFVVLVKSIYQDLIRKCKHFEIYKHALRYIKTLSLIIVLSIRNGMSLEEKLESLIIGLIKCCQQAGIFNSELKLPVVRKYERM